MGADLLELIVCPHCTSDRSHPWAQEGGFTAVKCDSCGLVYVNPRPSEETITQGHRIGMHRTATGESFSVRGRRHPLRISHYKQVLRAMFGAEIGRGMPLRWLDVGAGYGEFVEAVAAVLPSGSEVVGIEPMQPKVRVAQQRGLPIDDRPLSAVQDQFDVVSLILVFSHVPDFRSFGRELSQRIKPGGILFIETGNGGDLQRRADYPNKLFLPDHLIFAGVKQMEDIVNAIGFTVEATRQEPIDNPVWCLKMFVKGLLEGRLVLKRPYASPFRTVFYKCRKE